MPSSDVPVPARDIRQRELVPPARLARCHAVVIGVGAVGRQAALQLAAVGVPMLTLIDHDTVGPENLAPQGFREADLGRLKVEAVAEAARDLHAAVVVTTLPVRFRASCVRDWPADKDTVVFCCVDSIAVRERIWPAVRGAAAFFADGRIAGETIRILASDRPGADRSYAATLFAAEEAFAGNCTAKSTIYCANIAAGMMLAQFARWLRGQPVIRDQTLNLLAAELTVSDSAE